MMALSVLLKPVAFSDFNFRTSINVLEILIVNKWDCLVKVKSCTYFKDVCL